MLLTRSERQHSQKHLFPQTFLDGMTSLEGTVIYTGSRIVRHSGVKFMIGNENLQPIYTRALYYSKAGGGITHRDMARTVVSF